MQQAMVVLSYYIQYIFSGTARGFALKGEMVADRDVTGAAGSPEGWMITKGKGR